MRATQATILEKIAALETQQAQSQETLSEEISEVAEALEEAEEPEEPEAEPMATVLELSPPQVSAEESPKPEPPKRHRWI
jgi:Asp-tRNA(Asn)/Glu-tRNA(Gln) amidotransferase C subunit